MVTSDKRREYIEIYLQGAEHWRNKEDLLEEALSLSSALMNYLAIAVLEPDGFDGGNLVELKNDFLTVMSRYDEAVHKLIAGVNAGEYSASSVSGAYVHLVLVHAAWALGKYDLGTRFARIAKYAVSFKRGTPFWREYTAAINQLIDGQPYATPDLNLRGQEKYWQHYLHLIGAATQGRDMSKVIADIDQAFGKRNADKRIKDDNYELEGSAIHPVQWDFRKTGLLAYITSPSCSKTPFHVNWAETDL